jgi:non-heme chloroperoxidase
LSKPVSDAVMEWARDVGMMASVNATLACVRAFGSTDFRGDLAAFTVPTLVIHGTSDKVVPIDATGRVSAQMIRGAQLLEYEGAPHGLFVTHKEQLTSDLAGVRPRLSGG